MKILILIISLITLSCERERKIKELSEAQKKFLNTLTLEERIYYEDRIIVYPASMVLSEIAQTRMGKKKDMSDSSSGLADVAIGAAVGYGAAKVFSGKRK